MYVLFLLIQMTMPAVENSVGYLASGTSIQPKVTSESSPMIHRSFGNWTMMFHANAFLVDIQQTGPRGADKFFSANWLMPMLTRQFGRQNLTLRTMLSLEPATVTNRSYPLLFQSGETAYGFSLINGQHPHDFFMEIAARYDIRLGERSQVFVYGGPVGEAALGPTAFPHRPSASENPLAVLGHHQQDSSHIATNVVTVGMAAGPLQLEASGFHGREPDEGRWNVNRGKPDSFATRLTVAPHKNLTAQFSTGRLNSPEDAASHDTVRTTASVHYSPHFASGHLSSSLIWGRNKDLIATRRRIFNSYNLEITSKFRGRNWLWTRIENVDRDSALLPVAQTPSQSPPDCRLCGILGPRLSVLDAEEEVTPIHKHIVPGPDGRPIQIDEDPVGRVQAYTFGYERELPVRLSWLNVGLGAQFTTYTMPAAFKPVYGDRPTTVAFFLRLRPAGNMTDHMKMMHR